MSTTLPHLLGPGDEVFCPPAPDPGDDPPDDDGSMTRNYLGAVAAGLAKTVAAKSAGIAKGSIALTKGGMKWWFRTPIKLFRPQKVNAWSVLYGAASEYRLTAEAARLSRLGVLRRVLATEGWHIVPNHVAPLLLANAAAGIVLFNSYDLASHALKRYNREHAAMVAAAEERAAEGREAAPAVTGDDHHDLDTQDPLHDMVAHIRSHLSEPGASAGAGGPIHAASIPYMAGLFAGAVQAFATTPLENVHRWLDPEELVRERRSRTVVGHVREALVQRRDNMMRQGVQEAVKGWGWLWRGTSFVAFKDSLGFGMFFGTFELVKNLRLLSYCVDAVSTRVVAGLDRVWPSNQWLRNYLSTKWVDSPLPRAPDVVLGGATAGAAYQFVIYPLERLRPLVFPELLTQPSYDAVTEAYVRPDPELLRQTHRRRHHLVDTWVGRAPEVLQRHGWRYFFHGIGEHIARAVPPAAVALLIYEWLSRNVFDDED